jgi:hypothetical protein
MHIRESPAKAATNSQREIVSKATGAWLLCQESSALPWLAKSQYPLITEDAGRECEGSKRGNGVNANSADVIPSD